MNSVNMLRRALIGSKKTTPTDIWDYEYIYSAGNPPIMTSFSSMADAGNSYTINSPTKNLSEGTNTIIETEIKVYVTSSNLPQFITRSASNVGFKVYTTDLTTLVVSGGTIIQSGVDMSTVFTKIRIERYGTNVSVFVNDILKYTGVCITSASMFNNGIYSTLGSWGIKTLKHRVWS